MYIGTKGVEEKMNSYLQQHEESEEEAASDKELKSDIVKTWDVNDILCDPIIYTTKLDDMTVLKDKNLHRVNGIHLLLQIILESKPLLPKDKKVKYYKNRNGVEFKNSVIKKENLNLEKNVSVELENPHLHKNPDFKSEFKTLSPRFMTIERNRILLKMCKPVTIDINRDIDEAFIKDTLEFTTSTIKVEPNENAVILNKPQQKVSKTDVTVVKPIKLTDIKVEVPKDNNLPVLKDDLFSIDLSPLNFREKTANDNILSNTQEERPLFNILNTRSLFTDNNMSNDKDRNNTNSNKNFPRSSLIQFINEKTNRREIYSLGPRGGCLKEKAYNYPLTPTLHDLSLAQDPKLDYNTLNLSCSSKIKNPSMYNKTETIKYCCWYKRQERVSKICMYLPIKTIQIFRGVHMCSYRQCICCCNPKNQCLPTTVEDEPEFINMDNEITNTILSLNLKEGCNYNNETINLHQEDLKYPNLLEKALSGQFGLFNVSDEDDDSNSNTDTVNKEKGKNQWSSSDEVIDITEDDEQNGSSSNIKSSLIERALKVKVVPSTKVKNNCYFNSEDNRVSSATSTTFRIVFVYPKESYTETFQIGSDGVLKSHLMGPECGIFKSTESVLTCVVCCWYKKSTWLNYRNKYLPFALPTLTYIRNKHNCHVNKCHCCCNEMNTIRAVRITKHNTKKVQVPKSATVVSNNEQASSSKGVVASIEEKTNTTNKHASHESENLKDNKNSLLIEKQQAASNSVNKVTLQNTEKVLPTLSIVNKPEKQPTTSRDAYQSSITFPVSPTDISDELLDEFAAKLDIERSIPTNIIQTQGKLKKIPISKPTEPPIPIPRMPLPKNVNIMSNETANEVSSQEVHIIIDELLKRFQGVRLTLNPDGKVAALLDQPEDTLSTLELKILSQILNYAQEQVNTVTLTEPLVMQDCFPNFNGNIAINPNSQYDVCAGTPGDPLDNTLSNNDFSSIRNSLLTNVLVTPNPQNPTMQQPVMLNSLPLYILSNDKMNMGKINVNNVPIVQHETQNNLTPSTNRRKRALSDEDVDGPPLKHIIFDSETDEIIVPNQMSAEMITDGDNCDIDLAEVDSDNKDNVNFILEDVDDYGDAADNECILGI